MRPYARSLGFLAAGVLTAAGPAPAAFAAAAPPEAAVPSQAELDKAVTEIGRIVSEQYVDGARRPAVLAALAEGRRSGRYATASREEFAARVTADLKRASQDGHMYVNWRPAEHGALAARAARPAPDQGAEFWLELARRNNHGLEEQRILSGNVRYLKITSFLWDRSTSPAAYDAAMAFLAQGDAVVLDLRGNGGGSPEAVNYLTSHFVPAGTHLMTFLLPGGEERSVARDDLPAGRLSGKPLYVLIDKGVGSAGEEFAFHVDRFGLGKLTGETTAGAANRNELFPVAPGFVLSVSVGLARHAKDGSDWEGKGVAAHIPVEAGKALQTAHLDALETLARSGPEAYRRRHAWLAEGLRGRAKAPVVPASELAALAGTYGERTIRLEAGALTLQRAGGPTQALIPLGDDAFAVGEREDVRVRFERAGGRAARLILRYEDGRTLEAPRTGA